MSARGQSDASWDPRAWAGEATVPEPRVDAQGQPDRTVIAIAASAAILLAGAAAAYRARPPAQASPARVAIAPSPPPLVAAPAVPAGASQRTLVLASADEIGPMLLAAGIVPTQAREAAELAVRRLGARPGEMRVVYGVIGDRLASLVATRGDGGGVALEAKTSGFTARTIAAARGTRVETVRGEIDTTSFYSSAVAAGVNDSLIDDFAGAFAFDFDFQREIEPGDVFEATFERAVTSDGQPAGSPQLLYAALATAEKSRALYRWTPPGGKPGWYDGNGASVVRALMRTPVDGARISSNFGYRRHPILGFQKLHRGTDFAAPTGTPIYASGDATVTFAAMKGANGNFVRLLHDNGWYTLYLHLSRFAPGLTVGMRVQQGQAIGAVGTTGRSTGPHLHYEVHVDGQPVNPLSIPTGGGLQRLQGAELAGFKAKRDRIDVSRAKLGT